MEKSTEVSRMVACLVLVFFLFLFFSFLLFFGSVLSATKQSKYTSRETIISNL